MLSHACRNCHVRADFHGTTLTHATSLNYWQTRTHCCGHIVADTNVSPFARARNICCGHKFCVRETKMFLILFRNILCPQQMFPSLRAQGNIMSNNVSSFASTFTTGLRYDLGPFTRLRHFHLQN